MSISFGSTLFLMLSIFLISAVGYLLGKITIKGVSLGTAGVFIVALVFGIIFKNYIDAPQTVNFLNNAIKFNVSLKSDALSIVQNFGLILFVGSVGFIAGPNFFKNLKKNFTSYCLLGIVIILSAGIACLSCYFIGKGSAEDGKEFMSLLVGVLAGALTSTPAYSTALETEGAFTDAVSAGYAIAYIFGVLGVVIFVQIMPKLLKANMSEEIKLLGSVAANETSIDMGSKKKKLDVDTYGLFAFSLAAILGMAVGSIKIAGTFSLGTTGGVLLIALILGHFGCIGPISLKINVSTLKVFRELGLALFLIGAGVSGGAKFMQYASYIPSCLLYGIIMTIVPLILGFVFAKYVLKFSLLNNLGSITGGMTSTPALGTLIGVSGTDDVASAYAATYPIALVAVVLVAQGLILLA